MNEATIRDASAHSVAGISWDQVPSVNPSLGIYEIHSADKGLIGFGYAGSSARWGLREELQRWEKALGLDRARAIIDITSSYLSRYEELLLIHVVDSPRAVVSRGVNFVAFVRSGPTGSEPVRPMGGMQNEL